MALVFTGSSMPRITNSIITENDIGIMTFDLSSPRIIGNLIEKNKLWGISCYDFYFPAGGAAVRHIAAPGRVTMARLTRINGKYIMSIVPAEIVDLPKEKAEELAKEVQEEWPHAYLRVNASMNVFLDCYPCNHIHGVYGHYVDELLQFCKLKNIEYRLMGRDKE